LDFSWSAFNFIKYKNKFIFLIQNISAVAFFVIKTIGYCCDSGPLKGVISGILELVAGFSSIYICFGTGLTLLCVFTDNYPTFDKVKIKCPKLKGNITIVHLTDLHLGGAYGKESVALYVNMILNLKEKIAAHYNSNYTGFNIINGDDVIDNDQNNSTLSQKSIKRIVRLAENYDPANIDRFQFKQKTNL